MRTSFSLAVMSDAIMQSRFLVFHLKSLLQGPDFFFPEGLLHVKCFVVQASSCYLMPLYNPWFYCYIFMALFAWCFVWYIVTPLSYLFLSSCSVVLLFVFLCHASSVFRSLVSSLSSIIVWLCCVCFVLSWWASCINSVVYYLSLLRIVTCVLHFPILSSSVVYYLYL